MNANDAEQIIIAAIGEDRPLNPADLATALSHLGLLIYATDPHLNPPARATSEISKLPDQQTALFWAATRSRD